MTEKMSDGRRLRLAHGLRAMMPEGFPCKPGCFSCCQVPVQMLKVEWDELCALPSVLKISELEKRTVTVREKGVTVTVHDERGGCPFLGAETGKCLVHADRPLTCRVYGQSSLMRCREGVECPPALEISPDIVLKHGKLGDADVSSYSDLPTMERDALFWAMDEWRRRSGKRDEVIDSVTLRAEVHPIWTERLDTVRAQGRS